MRRFFVFPGLSTGSPASGERAGTPKAKNPVLTRVPSERAGTEDLLYFRFFALFFS